MGIHRWPVDSFTRADNAESVSIAWRHNDTVVIITRFNVIITLLSRYALAADFQKITCAQAY